MTTSQQTNPGQTSNALIEQMLKKCPEVKEAHFHSAVNNSERIPENVFNANSTTPSRRVQMWYTPHSLICKHKDQFFFVPLASVKFGFFAKED